MVIPLIIDRIFQSSRALMISADIRCKDHTGIRTMVEVGEKIA